MVLDLGMLNTGGRTSGYERVKTGNTTESGSVKAHRHSMWFPSARTILDLP